MKPLYHFLVHLVVVLVLGAWSTGPAPVAAATGEAALKVLLQVNNSVVTSLEVYEDQEKQVTFYLEDLPPQAVGDILILVSFVLVCSGMYFLNHVFSFLKNY